MTGAIHLVIGAIGPGVLGRLVTSFTSQGTAMGSIGLLVTLGSSGLRVSGALLFGGGGRGGGEEGEDEQEEIAGCVL